MKYKPKIAIVRGKFLNKYEMQSLEPLTNEFDLTAFGSLTPFHDKFKFPVVKLPSPMDLPEFPYKMPVLNRLFIDAHYLLGLEKKLKGFDIAHTAETYYCYTQQCLNAKRKKYVKKVIATVWENTPFNNEGILGRRGFKKKAIRELDYFVAVTKQAKDALIVEGVDPNKITIINPGINTQVFRPSSNTVSKFDINILFVGRLENYKGVYEIIYAAKKLLAEKGVKSFNVVFTFIGNGSEKKKLIKLEKHLGIEKFVIHEQVAYEQMPRKYQEADIFVAPSKPTATWQEQYNMALMEAQSAGLPIITTTSGAIPENVGNAAILIQPADSSSLVKAIRSLILNPKLRLEFSKKARKRAIEVHDAKITAKKLSNLYNFLLSK